MNLGSLPQGLQSLLLALGGLALGFFFKEWFSSGKEDKASFKKALQDNTIAITELRVEMKLTREALSVVQELERDVQKLGAKIRDLPK